MRSFLLPCHCAGLRHIMEGKELVGVETAILIPLAVLVIIAVLEVICLVSGKRGCERTPLTVAVPVFSDSEALANALARVRDTILRGRCIIDRIILIDYGADEASAELCGEFCRDFREALFIKPEDARNIFAEIFAISAEM